MEILKPVGFAIAVAMVLTALFLPGRSAQESAVLSTLSSLATGSIRTAEGRLSPIMESV
jgi:hypothetical protein